MKVLLFLALLGSAFALQAPVEYEYLYKARVGTGMQSSRPQYSGTGIQATVRVTVEEEGVGLIEVTDIKVGEANQMLSDDGREELPITYRPILDKALELPFKAHFRKHDGETVLEVPTTDLLWVTNIRRGIANFFRVAPIVDPSSIIPPPSGSLVEPQAFSRMEDTFAGRCRVSYTLTSASRYDIPLSLSEDIQSQQARKGPGGEDIKLVDDMYRLASSIDFTTCTERVYLTQTGAGNLTHITSTTYRDVATRAYVAQHILKGSQGKFRIENGRVESQLIFNPFGIDSDKMVIVSNQTMELSAARPKPRIVSRADPTLYSVKTWHQQVQSPNSPPHGYSPRFVVYKKEQEESQSPSPIYYEKLTSGFKYGSSVLADIKERVSSALKSAARRLDVQNKISTANPQGYEGSEDGRAAQDLQECHKLIRTLPLSTLKELDSELNFGSLQNNLTRGLFVETLAVAGSGPSLSLLMDKIENREISDNRIASVFFNIANNIQSPEILERMMKFVMELKEEDRVRVSLLSKINFAEVVRRLCVSPVIRSYSHMQYVYGDKMCDRSAILSQYVPHLEKRIEESDKIWVKILNVIALADLGAEESLPVLRKVARGEITQDNFVRFAAIHGMSVENFDNTIRDEIFNILQPIAESQVEDFRIRQVAYDSLLSWKPNVTFIQRMAILSLREPSKQIQSYIYWVMDSLSRIEDPSFGHLSTAARNLLPITRYMNPSIHRSMNYVSSKYLTNELVGITQDYAWLTQYKSYFPREVYTFISGKYGRFSVPLLETVTFGNTQSVYAALRDTVEHLTNKKVEPSAERQQRRESINRNMRQMEEEYEPSSSEPRDPDFYSYLRMWRTSEVFLPLTNELYSSLQSRAISLMKNLKDKQRVIIHKYMSPVETNLILPTPVGLFTHIEVSTPTVMYANLELEASSSPPISDPSLLPSLERINIKAEGIVKFVSKTNTYTYVLAPWTNKTIFAAVDNEKSFSLPLKLETVAELRLPAQILWAQITPKFTHSSEKIPLMKIRNVPFTAIGGLLPSPVAADKLDDFKQIHSVYSPEQETEVIIPISKINTGLEAEIYYRGEPSAPLIQPRIYEYLSEPSRLISLLASPSTKKYDFSIYKLPTESPTKTIGFYLRHLIREPEARAPHISVPASAGQPIDISPEDSQPQREHKLAQFSDQRNHEISIQVNFTGSVVKKYEASVIFSTEERSVASEQVKRIFGKIQVSLVEKNQESTRKPMTCLVAVIDRPELQPLARTGDLLKAHQEQWLQAPVAANLYEGSSCKSSDRPTVDAFANLTVSDNRIKAMMDVSANGDFYYDTTSEFFRLAVYDQLHMEVNWRNPSLLLRNTTLRTRDLIEGYMYPNIVKNRDLTHQDGRMVVRADRSISDDRAEAFVDLPMGRIQVQRVGIQPLFDWVSGFTTDIYSPRPRTARQSLRSSPPSDKCFIFSSKVRTFDAVDYQKKPSVCKVIAAKVKLNEDNILIWTRQVSESPSSEQEIHIISSKGAFDIKIEGRRVVVNERQITEESHELKDEAGNVIARVEKSANKVVVLLPNKVRVELKEGKMLMIKLDQRFRNSVKGLCGNYDMEAQGDLRGPKGCVYPPSKGEEFAAAWMPRGSAQCQDPPMVPLFEGILRYQERCPKGRSPISSSIHDCTIPVYPIRQPDSRRTCVSTTPLEICAPGCSDYNRRLSISTVSKCYPEASAPQDLKDSLRTNSYLTSPETSTIPSQSDQIAHNMPMSCHRRPVTTGEQCRIQAYPVQSLGPMICVTTERTDQCKIGCTVGDVTPIRMPAKCWNEDRAPHPIMQAIHQGYVTSPVSEHGQFSQDIIISRPRDCFQPQQ